MTNKSIFSKIIDGEIPAHKIYEDDKNLAFLDVAPVNPGHALVVPKVQVDNLWNLSEADYMSLMLAAKKVARHMQQTLNTKRVGMAVEGFKVPHAHIHLIPINQGFEVELAKPKTDKNTPEDLEEMARLLRFK